APVSLPALLTEEGKFDRPPLAVRGGGGAKRRGGGVQRRRTTRPRPCRVPPSSTRRANSKAFPSSSRRGGAKRRGGGVQRRRTTCPRHCRVLPSLTGGQRPEHSPPHRGGVARSDGAVGFNAAGPPVRDTVASCPPSQEGKDRSIPLLIEEGGREATGWWGSTPQDHLSATLSRPAILARRAKTAAFPSSSRRGGAKRRGGPTSKQFRHGVQD